MDTIRELVASELKEKQDRVAQRDNQSKRKQKDLAPDENKGIMGAQVFR
jgi:hypothetical protein